MTIKININGSDDPSYRYKMSKLEIKEEGKGSGIKTVILNLETLSKEINREPEHITKWFGIELGTQSNWNSKFKKAEIKGHHDIQDLQTLFQKFINLYVLCPECWLPETDLVINKKGQLKHRCQACGAKKHIQGHHKLTSHIIKCFSHK